jgi:hypothetical protein
MFSVAGELRDLIDRRDDARAWFHAALREL